MRIGLQLIPFSWNDVSLQSDMQLVKMKQKKGNRAQSEFSQQSEHLSFQNNTLVCSSKECIDW